jgi:hypothetical protein
VTHVQFCVLVDAPSRFIADPHDGVAFVPSDALPVSVAKDAAFWFEKEIGAESGGP